MQEANDKSSFYLEVLEGFKEEIQETLKDYLHLDDADMFIVDIVTNEIKDFETTIKKYIDDKIVEACKCERDYTD